MLEAGQSAQISTSVNPELMGGMIVSIGDKYTEMKENVIQSFYAYYTISQARN